MSVGLFTTEIYANWARKEELERWVWPHATKVGWVSYLKLYLQFQPHRVYQDFHQS